MAATVSTKKEQADLIKRLRAENKTWSEIAGVFRERFNINGRVALRLAHQLSQKDVADAWNARWPDEPMTFKKISCWEQWPGSTGHQPSLSSLKRLAEIYECSVGDLVADYADYTYLDKAYRINSIIGQKLKAERHRKVGSVNAMAHALRENAPKYERGTLPTIASLVRMIRSWECGQHELSERYKILYCRVLDVNINELFATIDEYGGLANEASISDKLPSRHPREDGPFDDAPASNKFDPFATELNNMERRLFLQLAASLGLGSITEINSREAHAKLFELAVAAEPRDIEEWELACTDHLYALRTRPPLIASRDLLIDLSILQRQLQESGSVSSDLQRVLAALSTLHANLLTRRGEHGAAIRWWRTARQAADASGDLELRLGVRATEAGHGLFGQRSPETVLQLTQNAQRIAGDAPSLGLALVQCSEAKALSELGRHEDAQRELHAYRDRLSSGTLSATDIMSGYWNGGQLHFAESQIFAFAGDEAATSEAIENVLASANGDYQILPSVKLHEALCIVKNGGVDRGTRQASSIVDGLPASHLDVMTLEHGYRVLRAVPIDSQDLNSVREFRAILTTASGYQNKEIAK